MQTFTYTIKDEVGLHARPAGQLVKEAKNFKSEIVIEKDGKSVSATRLMMLMGLGIKNGETIKVTISGDDEKEAAKGMEEFFKNHL